MKILKSLLFVVSLVSSSLLFADGYQELQSRWAEVNYQVDKSQQLVNFKTLAAEAERQVSAHPDDANLRIWYGIILSSWAGADGGLGALGHVKEAKRQFEWVIEHDAKALDGSALTSLGSLYYQVPSWPVAFGDKRKAESLLRQGLEVNPAGIDSNYFMADFLIRQKRYADARRYLDVAKAAPDRPGRAVADAGRRQEVEALYTQLK